MIKFKTFYCFFILLTTLKVYAQERTINVTQITPKTYIHESFLQTKDWGKVSCNGLIFINDHKAVVFDTPANEEATSKLIDIIQDSLKAEIVGVVINHFHVDCLAGLKVFHQLNIPSYSSNQTIALAKSHGYKIPKHGFKHTEMLNIDGEKVYNYYFGGAHTRDNIVSYIPSEKVLFGGCMVKALGANKGNLEEADTLHWSKTIGKVKKLKPEVVVPGHGKWGGTALLDYTEELFESER